MELDHDCNSSLRKLVKHVGFNEAKDKNFAFSPFSIYSSLSLLASGAEDETLEQLLGFLKRENLNDLNTYVSKLMNSLDSTNKNTKGDDGPVLSLVRGVWVDRSCTFQPSYKEVATSIYKAETDAVDFKNQVNAWAKERTNGLITDLLPEGSPSDLTRLMCANAIYIKGSWEEDQFNPELTENSKFYLLEKGTSVEVPFMGTSIDYLFVSCFDSFKVLRLPYKQATTSLQELCISMYIFLSNERDGLADLIEKVSSESANFLERHLPKEGVLVRHFKLPKFKILFGFEMSRVLKNDLGLDLPFHKECSDLTKMVSVGTDVKRLFVSKIVHKCSIEFDEQGTEAAASTFSDEDMCGCMYDRTKRVPLVDFVADHPFMFIVRDDVNATVLF